MAACKRVEFYAISEPAQHLEHHKQDYPRGEALIENALAGSNSFSEDERDYLSHRLKWLIRGDRVHILNLDH
jgi:hypothetical protein